MRLMPSSRARRTSLIDSASSLWVACPKRLWPPVPRLTTDTCRPVLPSGRYSMGRCSVTAHLQVTKDLWGLNATTEAAPRRCFVVPPQHDKMKNGWAEPTFDNQKGHPVYLG